MAKTVFDLKNIFWSISSGFAFKQAKEHILFQVKTLKMWNEKKNIPHFWVTPLIFWGLPPKERGNIKTWNFDKFFVSFKLLCSSERCVSSKSKDEWCGAQAAESGVKKRRGGAVSQPEQQRRARQCWVEQKKSRRDYRRAPGWEPETKNSRLPGEREPRATAAATGLRAAGATSAVAMAEGDYRVHHCQGRRVGN